jgi:uncharacterized membrane protein
MSQIRIETVSHKAPRPRILGSAVRTLTLGLATLATGLVAGVFYASFFGAVPFLLATLAAHIPRPRPGRFRLVALACVLYIVGGFLLTAFVNVPMNEELARVAANASPDELAAARAAYEGPWDFWNGVRTVFSSMAFLALIGACLLREDRSGR